MVAARDGGNGNRHPVRRSEETSSGGGTGPGRFFIIFGSQSQRYAELGRGKTVAWGQKLSSRGMQPSLTRWMPGQLGVHGAFDSRQPWAGVQTEPRALFDEPA